MSPVAESILIVKGTRGGKSRAALDLSTFASLPDTAYVRLPTVIALTST